MRFNKQQPYNVKLTLNNKLQSCESLFLLKKSHAFSKLDIQAISSNILFDSNKKFIENNACWVQNVWESNDFLL